MMNISFYLLPAFILLAAIFALKNKTNAFKSFTDGASEGIDMAVKVFPYVLAMIFAVEMLKASGFLLDTFRNFQHLPLEIAMQGIFKPISGNGSLVLMLQTFEMYGVDSREGITASLLFGSTDTTFYVCALYFGSVGITKYKYALPVSLLSDIFGFALCLVFYFFIL